MLERGVIPWRKGWTGSGVRDAAAGISFNQANLKTGAVYRGINQFLLSGKYAAPYWVSYKQAQELGGNVKKGEKSSIVVYWLWTYYDNQTRAKISEERARELINTFGAGRVAKIGRVFYYNVFNVEQCEGLKVPEPADPVPAPVVVDNKIQAIEAFLAAMKDQPSFIISDRAYYSPARDIIGMPLINAFALVEDYYATRFHEITHWTGAATRLNRAGVAKGDHFGSEKYSKEELIAEMGSAFLCDLNGISTRVLENQVSYIANWLEVLKNDKKMVIEAAAAAQKAAEYVTRGMSTNEPISKTSEKSETAEA
jgi:antirestriction protein ArdC